MVAKLNITSKLVAANLWKRFLAYVIDFLIINLFISLPFEKYIKNVSLNLLISGDETIFKISLVIAGLTLLYFVLLEQITKQTIGKMILNIYVASKEKELRLQQTILRNLTKSFPIVLLVDVLYMFFKKTNQRLFEVFSGTYVVEKGMILK